jgi:3-oxoacyl-[acyl-carrier-protein] synthase-3
MNIKAIITGTGRYVPPKIVTNFDLEKIMNTTDEWIRQRSGIVERHYAESGVGSSDLAYEAALKAIENAGIEKSSIGALDVRNQCTGFIYALSVADHFIRAQTYKKILIVAAEVQSLNLDYSDDGRDIAVLFGDGAGAAIIEANEKDDERGVLSTHLFSDGRYATELWMEKPGCKESPFLSKEILESKQRYAQMDGRRVFISAVEKMPEAVNIALKQNGLTIEDVDHLIPHQANDRISQMVAKNLKIPVEKVVRNIDRFGNTTAASIPIALDETLKEGKIKKGDIVVLTAFGSGFTWGSAIIRF